jgi:hypothetical protein
MAINGQTQPQKFSLYRYREGKSDPEHGKWFKRQDQGGPNKRTMQRLLLTLGLVAISLRSALYAEDPIRYDPVSRQVIEGRLHKYVGNDKQREDTPRQMFSQIFESICVSAGNTLNVTCALPHSNRSATPVLFVAAGICEHLL